LKAESIKDSDEDKEEYIAALKRHMERKEEKKKTNEEVRERLRKDRTRRLAEKELAE